MKLQYSHVYTGVSIHLSFQYKNGELLPYWNILDSENLF